MRDVPDLDALAKGRLTLLQESKGEYGRVAVQLIFGGIELANDRTWREWVSFRAVELWEAVCLQLHLDPATVAWENLDTRATARGPTIGSLFGERLAVAVKHLTHGSLPAIKVAADPSRSLVTLWEFAEWCDAQGIPCPAEFPRRDPSRETINAQAEGTQRKRRAAAPSDEFLRQADLIPGMLPFPPATLWRKVKDGTFPAPIRLSAGVTAWRRAEVMAWLKAFDVVNATKRKGRSTR